MIRKLKRKDAWKRGISTALACVMAVSMIPTFSLSASAEEQTEELLKAGSLPATEETITKEQPMFAGTAGSLEFRIPAFIALKNGENAGNLVSAADIRYTSTKDGGGFDTFASVSTDMGRTWNYSYPIYFPDSDKYDGNNATTAIDPALVEGPDGTIYCVADMNPTGVTTLYTGTVHQGTGYVEINGTDRLVLTGNYANTNTLPSESDTAYEYYVGDFVDGYAPVLNRSDDSATAYVVDDWYNIYTVANGTYTAKTQKQTNTDRDVQQNVFYQGSELHVYNTGYIWMVESHDGGFSWENPRILNPQIKRDEETALLVSPGKGLTTKDGVITIPFYNHYGASEEAVSFIYSKDNGATWKRTNDVTREGTSGWTSESETVELADGTLRTFSRNGGGTICYSDAIKDANGDYSMGTLVSTGITCRSECNITAITYSQKIDGKEAILVACPSTRTSRTNGVICTFLVNEDKTLTLKSTFAMPKDYGSGFAYSCMDELSDGTIGILYEPDEGNLQRIIYDNFDIYEILGQKTTVDLSENDTYTVSLGTGTECGNITKQPDEEIASAATEKVATEGALLYAHTSNTASSLNSFSANPDLSKSLEDCELVFTSTGTDGVYTVQNEATGKYWNTNNPASYFVDSSVELKVVSTTANGNTTFRICLNSSGRRFIVFYPTNMIFDAYGDYSDTATNVDFEMVLLEKQDSVSEGDVLPGYTRASSIQEGKHYLVSYIWSDGSVIVLYPENSTDGQTKLVKANEGSMTTLTFTKGEKAGVTEAVVDGHSYEILSGVQKAEKLTIGRGESVTLEVPAEAEYICDGVSAEESAAETKAVLYDHEAAANTSGFMAEPNSNYTLEGAELEFISVGSSTTTFQVKGRNGRYLQNSTDIWSTTPSSTSFQAVSGKDGAYNVAAGDTYSTSNRHICFNPQYNRFDANGSKTGTSVDFDLLLLEKKDTAAASDVIPGYQKASSLTSGKYYLITYVASDGAIYVLYPFENYEKSYGSTLANSIMNFQTKKYGSITTKEITVTGKEAGKASLIVDGTYYDITVEYTKKEIEAAVEQAKTLYEAGRQNYYSDEAWNSFQKAYEAAVNLKQGAAASEDIYTALQALDEAKTLLTEEKRQADEELNAAQAQKKEALAAAKGIYDAGQGTYTLETWAAFKAAYEVLSSASDNYASELTRLTAALREAQNKLQKTTSSVGQVTDAQKEPVVTEIKEGQVYDSGNYYYKVTSTSKMTAQVTGLKNTGLKKITIYNTVTLGGKKYTVTSIAPSAFKNNKKITSVTIQKNVQVIGGNAFAGCAKLKKVTAKSTKLKNVGTKAFYNCKKLTSITIKSKVLKKVGKNALKGISAKAVIKVPAAKLKAYTKLLAKKGQSSTVKIKK